jgi:hypothetical protein
MYKPYMLQTFAAASNLGFAITARRKLFSNYGVIGS